MSRSPSSLAHNPGFSSVHAAAKFLCSALPLALLMAAPLSAEETTEETRHASKESKRCIAATRIDNTEIINDRTIVFHMLGNEIYLNNLPHRCPSMRKHKTIGYKTQTSQLCSVDTITVLENMGGISRGPTCGLGPFVPITKEELRALKNPEKDPEPKATQEAASSTE